MENETVKSECTISKEVAKEEFDRWIKAMRIKIEREGLNLNDVRDNKESAIVIIDTIVEGRIIISDEGILTFITEDNQSIVFHRPKGHMLLAMSKRKQSDDFGKIFASLAEITKTSSITFANMYESDLNVCMEIYGLFLAK